MESSYDLSRKRPLEIRVLDRRDEGGISEEAAQDQNGVTADAFLMMRVLVDEDKMALSFAAIEGWAGGEMSFEALFNLWISLAGHIARRPEEGLTPDQNQLRVFAERVLNLMRLNVEMAKLAADAAAEQEPGRTTLASQCD